MCPETPRGESELDPSVLSLLGKEVIVKPHGDLLRRDVESHQTDRESRDRWDGIHQDPS